MSLLSLLPEKFREVPAWKDFAEAFEEVIFNQSTDCINELKKLRDPFEVDAAFIRVFKNLLGVPVDIDNFETDSQRRILETVDFYYERSATKVFVQFLSFIQNAKFDFEELYSFRNIDGEFVASGNGGAAYTFTYAAPPIEKGNLTVSVSSQTVTDDGDGNLIGGGSGTIDYVTGEINVTFNAPVTIGDAITSSYKTNVYQGFFNTPPGVLVEEGGDSYLTNHINLVFDVVKFNGFNRADIEKIFYQLAPAPLVLNDIIAEFLAVIASMHIIMAGIVDREAEGLISPALLGIAVGGLTEQDISGDFTTVFDPHNALLWTSHGGFVDREAEGIILAIA